MIEAKYDWKIEQEKPDDGFFKLAKKNGLTELSAQILFERGISSQEAMDHFLRADLADLHDPFLLNDMEKAVNRIRQAIENYEQILIYGDYDADGMTSASIMKETLEMLGAEVLVYLPNRFTDGYGPNLSVYKYFMNQEKVSLILTVDNGVSGHEAISYAQANGVDVIVTDHHSLPNQLPEAFAIIHPEHPNADYPFKKLAGCGVAFKLATALLDGVPTELLDLVAIGTIADMVSLTDENRILVKNGLHVLKSSERVGLQELMALSQVDFDHFDEEVVGFKLAPQLNALGRLDDPNPAIELLTGFDEEEAQGIARMINGKNEERKALVQTIFEEAIAMVDTQKPVQVLAKEGWHPGVLGIVAGRIMEETSQTVLVLAIENGFAKGSARSIEAINIFKALNHSKDLLTAFGGHEGAAGMTLPVENIPLLSEALCHYVTENEIDWTVKNSLKIDHELQLEEINLETIKNLNFLAPFGMDHPQPIFLMKDFQVIQARTLGADNKHLKFRIRKGSSEVDVLAFNQGHLLQEFQQSQGLELAVTLSVNVWNGCTSLQLMLIDARVMGIQLYDIRAKKYDIPNHLHSVFDSNDSKEAVLDYIPEETHRLFEAFKDREFTAIYFKNLIDKPYYLSGYGTKDQFTRLYKTIYQFPEFDVRYKLTELSNYLKIDKILLIKMIQIFEELEFVTIIDGVMTVNKGASKKAIANSQIYQNLKELVKIQEIMALATPQEIYQFLKENSKAKENEVDS
ncbi:single-stranded-DNA-specific exonuclease RecJ [Streptococcus uberis]|uniref:single-stranded-DNA-specific exonuclease RecJ n=1 Tax=Streptococcus uberis TaxID=1349 RepID=UPI0012B631BB|nr:single-stranded-DNA-specific exonuclease RecJ [Streptococcus uberis]MCK1227961.1 single-stranded-DNA-specific exonuclease RecJ [Streptococcus uberis]MTB34953.1 single-stranded-DNA-specific exonuclease RecJ [Streptococcus uberis]MTB37543.1 single-stranded-DNA-specific exonuclease RecJ [Streptococcus uberis]MTB55618.1 single-stranded-DNA-specific exonuclease RecJ [Streptococcus uberis]MTB59934.1 single-stranded-DNA-specific exonuclease RecJ [Streptococcus uberis]